MNISRISNTSSSRLESFSPASFPRQNEPNQQSAPVSPSAHSAAILNPAEKEFFAGAFPAASAAIRSHTVYTHAGKSSAPPSPGGLIDWKG